MRIKKIIKAIEGNEKLLIVPFFKGTDAAKSVPADLVSHIEKRVKSKDFNGKKYETLVLMPDEKGIPSKILLAGFGEKKNLSAERARNCAGVAIKKAKEHDLNEVSVYIPAQMAKFAEAFAEGLGMGNYNPAVFQTGKIKTKNETSDVKEITVIAGALAGGKTGARAGAALKKELETGLAIAAAVNESRDLVNAPASLKTVAYLADRAKEIARQSRSSIRILEKKELEKMGMGGIIGVNKGSTAAAKMVIMEHKPFGSKKEPIVIIGKGIVFDSGGYNLKPRDAMTDMKMDMAGAAAVMGVFRLLKQLGVRQHVVGIFPLTENLIGPDAIRPSDIITTYSGNTVEIGNTDGEGRLILADAISYAVKNCRPRCIIDLATLTGACVMALGEKYAGLFGNDKNLIEQIRKAGESVDELVWHMPIHRDDAEKMKGVITDYRNWDPDYSASLCKSAAFLRFFTGKTKWAHLDIAGTAFVKSPKKYEAPMATGFGIRLLLEYLKKA